MRYTVPGLLLPSDWSAGVTWPAPGFWLVETESRSTELRPSTPMLSISSESSLKISRIYEFLVSHRFPIKNINKWFFTFPPHFGLLALYQFWPFFTNTFSMYSRSVSFYHITWRRREFLYLDSSYYCPPPFPLPPLLHYLHLLHTKSRSDCCGMKQIVWSWVCNKNDIRYKDLIFVSSVWISSSSHIPARHPPLGLLVHNLRWLIDNRRELLLCIWRWRSWRWWWHWGWWWRWPGQGGSPPLVHQLSVTVGGAAGGGSSSWNNKFGSIIQILFYFLLIVE